jgi:hypothetical protein
MPVSLSPGMTPSIKSDSAPNLSTLCLEPKGNKGQHTWLLKYQSGWPQTLLFISPSVGTVPVPCLASDHARSRFDDGGGLLRADKYHKRKVCQDGIAAHH